MAFKRVIQMDVGQNNATGLRISSLNVGFTIERSITRADNTAIFQVYNAKEETRKKILARGNNIIFKAGYEDEGNLGLIFSGIITDSDTKKDGVTWVTEIQSMDIGNDLNSILKQIATVSYSAGVQLSAVTLDIIGLLGTPVAGIANLTGITLNNGFVYSGSISGLIRKLRKIFRANNIGLYFDLGEFVIYRLGFADSVFGVVNITPKSGLIGEVSIANDETEDDDEKERQRIAFVSLMNPKIKPNTVINIQSEKVNGAYIVEKATYAGDNFGGDFSINVECVE